MPRFLSGSFQKNSAQNLRDISLQIHNYDFPPAKSVLEFCHYTGLICTRLIILVMGDISNYFSI